MPAHQCSFISGFVLAGGESRRMGQPKPQLVLGSTTLLERQIRLLASACRSVAVVGSNAGMVSPDVQTIPDVLPGCGPLGGIHAALAASRTDFNLVVACDLPFLTPRFLRRLAERAILTQADVTIPEDQARRTVPVCAVFRKRIQGILRARLSLGLNKADSYLRYVQVHRLAWRDIRGAGFSPHLFDNINRPEDFEEAQRRLALLSS
jgi:molybdopterin-guanine dinucleotide biosynthesis protein A